MKRAPAMGTRVKCPLPSLMKNRSGSARCERITPPRSGPSSTRDSFFHASATTYLPSTFFPTGSKGHALSAESLHWCDTSGVWRICIDRVLHFVGADIQIQIAVAVRVGEGQRGRRVPAGETTLRVRVGE